MRELEGSKAPQTARRTPRARSRRGPEPANHLRCALPMTWSHPIFTWRSCFFKASFRRRTYYMNRSLSLPFTDRALPSAIRPGGFSHSRLARGAQGSRPHPADSHGAIFPSAPLRRPGFPSRGGEAHRGVSLPASQRTAAASHRGGPAFKRGNCRAARRSQSPRPIGACHPTKPAARRTLRFPTLPRVPRKSGRACATMSLIDRKEPPCAKPRS